jgi:metal-sulfur cluster biosynthetic enzyme
MSEQTEQVEGRQDTVSEQTEQAANLEAPTSEQTEPVERREVTEEGLREALRVVTDPEIGMNVIELGLIRGVEIGDERVHLNVIMTTPFCPYAPQLLEQIRRTAQEYAGVPATIEMGMEMWDPTMMEEGAADDWGLF